MTVLTRPAAAADIEEAFLWYERRAAGLGDEFLQAPQSTLDAISTQPASYPVIHRGARRALIHRFPYGIIFRVSGETVVVVACLHGRRDPTLWRSRP